MAFNWKKLYAPKTLKIGGIVLASILALIIVAGVVLAFIPVKYTIEFDRDRQIMITYYNKELTNAKELMKRDREDEIKKIFNLLDDATTSNMFADTLGFRKGGTKNIEIYSSGKPISETTLKSEGAYLVISVEHGSPEATIMLNKKPYLNPRSGMSVAILELIIQLENIEDEWAPISVWYRTSRQIEIPDENSNGSTWTVADRAYFKLNTFGNLYKLSQYIKNLRVESLV